MAVELIHLAAQVTAVSGIIVGLGIIFTKTPLKRFTSYVWRNLVRDPLSQWFQNEVREALEPELEPIRNELRTNGGSSLKDAVNRVDARLKRIEDAQSE